MIRRLLEKELNQLKREFPVIAVLGPRQSGKTTLSRMVFSDYTYISLEDIDHREFARDDPRGFLDRFSRNVIFDEIQRVPSLMSYLQSHVDSIKLNGSIVITGSHNFFLMEQISQSLAGRVGITKLLPFTYSELSEMEISLEEIMFKGGYPRIYDQGIRPEVFYKNYISTYIEKDILQIAQITKLDVFQKFIKILAGRTGQELNTNTLGDECGVSHNTVKSWLSILETSFLIYRLKPFHKNYNKRIVKNPKIYFTDTGLVCSLLSIRKKEELNYHFLKGHIFETFIVNEFVKYNFHLGERFELYFWRDNHKKEIDLILDTGIEQFAAEIKSGKTVQGKFLDTLKYWKNLSGNDTKDSFLIYGGKDSYKRDGFNVTGWQDIFETVIEPALIH
jgi:predicted AAA+ superfamily ATPase